MSSSVHLNVVLLIVVLIDCERRSSKVLELAVEEVAQDGASSLIEIGDASLLEETLFAGDLREEFLLCIVVSYTVVAEEFFLLHTAEEGLNWALGVLHILDADSLTKDQ